MEFLDQDFQANTGSGIQVTPNLREDWRMSARWANFIAIVGFVFIGIGLLAAGSMSTLLANLPALGLDSNPVARLITSMGAGFGLIMLVLLGVQFYITLFHFRFAKNLKRAIEAADQPAFEEAWLHFRNVFRWNGIVLIVTIALYFIAAIVIFVFADSIISPSM